MTRQCLAAISDHWPGSARLALPNRARFRTTGTGYHAIMVNGWVWDEGTRKKATHQCHFTPKKEFVLNVALPD